MSGEFMKLLKSFGFVIYFLVVQCIITGSYLLLRLWFDTTWLNAVSDTFYNSGAMSFAYLKLIAQACLPAMLIADCIACIPIITFQLRRHFLIVRKPSIKSFFVVSTLALVINTIISIIVNQLPNSALSSFYNSLIYALIGNNRLVVFLTSAIVAPITEELVFRFCICKVLYADRRLLGIIVSSSLFALAHFNVIQSTYAFVLGLILGYIYVYSNFNLTLPILFHFIVNGSSVLYEYFSKQTILVGLLFLLFSITWLFLCRLQQLFEDTSCSLCA